MNRVNFKLQTPNSKGILLWSLFFGVWSFLSAAQPAPKLPPRLESYITSVVRPSAEERRELHLGAPVTKLLPGDESREIGVFGAVWIDAPVSRYVEKVNDIEAFERGGKFKVTKRISRPPRLEDFRELHLAAKDVEDLRTCRVGHCDVKLGAEELKRFRQEVDWRSPAARDAVNGLMRQLALEYVTGYLDGGNTRLAVYRDKSRPTFVATEFREMVDQMPELTTYMPDVRRHLLEYPKFELPGSVSYLYWQEAQFGLKPTIRFSHVTIHEQPDETVVASKMLYASHYFWTALELRVLVPDPARGAGFWFVTVSRSRADGLSGFVGLFVRGRARRDAERGTLTALMSTKRRLEQ